MVLNAHGQRVDEDGDHDAPAEVSAGHDQVQFAPQLRPAASAQAHPGLRGLRAGAAAGARGLAAGGHAVAAAALLLDLLVGVVAITELLVVNAVGAGLQRDLAGQRQHGATT